MYDPIGSCIWLAAGSPVWNPRRVRTAVSPSLQLLFLLADAFASVSVRGLTAAWNRFIGPQRFHRKLAQFERRGWLEKTTDRTNLDAIVRLTEMGRVAAHGGRDPEACWQRPWDGRWRLVLFDVPESERAMRLKLRRMLRTLRFGYLQNSAWITPDSVTTLRSMIRGASTNVETLSLMEARPCGGETDADVVSGAWNFDRINHDYEIYLDVLRSEPRVRATGRVWRNWFDVECRAWHRSVSHDPLLPNPLLPRSYRGKEAWRRRMEKMHDLVQLV